MLSAYGRCTIGICTVCLVSGCVQGPDYVKPTVSVPAQYRFDQLPAEARSYVKRLEEVRKQLEAELAARGMLDSVKFTIDERGLVVTIVTSSVIFAGDSAELQEGGRGVLDSVGPTIATLPNRIQVDGHTNQLPVQTRNYPSGWELSSARASSVVRYLISRFGLPAARMSAAGYADTRPLIPPSDPQAATMNRRVEVIVMSTLPANEAALLPGAAADTN